MDTPVEGELQGSVVWDRPWTPARSAEVRALTRAIAPLPTLTALHESDVWRRGAPLIRRVLNEIQAGSPAGIAMGGEAGPSAGAAVVRAVQWNILKGVAFDAIASALELHPRLRGAQIVLLNEVDVGTARSGNRHVAGALAERLGLHWAFAPSYLELTKGPRADALAPGENELGLHGVALLTRVRPLALAAVALPDIFDYFAHSEKRLGRRRGLLASLPGGWVVGAVHLEVRNTPAARARQLAAFLDGVEAFCAAERRAGRDVRRVLLAGDLNTHTFARGSLARGLAGFLRLTMTPRERLRAELRRPWAGRREPLFGDLRRRGYEWRPFNDEVHSAWAPLVSIDEAQLLPRLLDPLLRRVLGPDRRGLPLRLDWFLGRGLEVAPGHEPPRTLLDLLDADPAPSDHAPLTLVCAP